MAFAMRVNFVDVICDDSLRNEYVNGKKNGYAFDIRLSYYRGHFLSDIDKLELFVDGEFVAQKDIFFCLNGKEFYAEQLSECYTEFWNLLEPAKIRVRRPNGLEKGAHEIKLNLMLRVPYLPLPGADNDHMYMPLDCGGEKVLTLCEFQGDKENE